jgi:hypothetical protein
MKAPAQPATYILIAPTMLYVCPLDPFSPARPGENAAAKVVINASFAFQNPVPCLPDRLLRRTLVPAPTDFEATVLENP